MHLRKLKYLFLFAVVSGFLTLVWFKDGLYFGGAEVGLSPYYNPQRFLDIQKYIWWKDVAPGMLIPHFIVGVPLYFFLSLLQPVTSPVFLQAFFTFLTLFLMGYGMYKFCQSVIGGDKNFYAAIAGFFYMFNSYTMVEVWHRFLYTGFFLAATLPFLALLWNKWIEKGKIQFLTLFLLLNLAFSYMFGNLTSAITLWLLLFLLTFLKIIFPWQDRKVFLKITFKFLFGLIFWIATNLWWIVPSLLISTTFLPEQHTSEDNIDTLINIGKQTILPYLLQFANPYYLFYTKELGEIYKSFIFLILPWVPAVTIFIGLLTSLKQKFLSRFAIMYVIFILFSKGAAPPFGEAYIWGFINFYILGVIRNPFEKLGILLPFCASILFVIGIQKIYEQSSKKFGLVNSKYLVSGILLSVLVYAWPMFTGKVISKPTEPLLNEVPSFYKTADEWLEAKEKSGTILHLPFSGDVVTYKWEHGYHGVEINELLFTSHPSITRNVGVKRIDENLKGFTYIFNKPFIDKDKILKMLEDFNVRFIVLHKEIKEDDVSTFGKNIKLIDTLEMEKTLNSLDFLEQAVTIGDLKIYQIRENKYKPKIALFHQADLIYPGNSSQIQIIQNSKFKNHTITPLLGDFSKENKITSVTIYPENSFGYTIPSESEIFNQEFMLKQLKSMREYFSQAGQFYSEELILKMDFATRKLEPSGGFSSLEYEKAIKEVFKNNFKSLSALKLFRSQIGHILYSHLYKLESLKERRVDKTKISEIQKIIIEGLKNNDLAPAYLDYYLPSKKEISRRVLKFKIPQKQTYTLNLIENALDAFPNGSADLDLQINGQTLKNTASGFDFDKGDYELSYNSLITPNLIPTLDKFFQFGTIKFQDSNTAILSSASGVAFLETPISSVDSKDVYKISFEGQVSKNTNLYIEIIEDTEKFDDKKEYQSIESGECSFHTCYPVNLEGDSLQSYIFTTTAFNTATKKANVRILLANGEALIRNFKLSKIYDKDIFLNTNLFKEEKSENDLVISRESTIKYSGNINITSPSFIFLKESFNPGWVLTLSKDGKNAEIPEHFIGDLYGNSWYIPEKGSYNFNIEFMPQKTADYGIILSLFSWIILLIMLIIKGKKYESI